MHKNLVKLLLIAIISIVCRGIDQGDWVNVFELDLGLLPHPFYAGYLNITSSKAYYYAYFPSQNNPSKDPLVVRLSAGPGCSSLHSAFYSKGPFIFLRNQSDFRINPFNWNKNANLLFIEGPAGVGFSYGNEQTQLNDKQSTQDTFLAILKFYQKFPELKDQKLYLTGQQYAGITIPNLAIMIVQHNTNPDTPSWQKIQLNGILLNSPCTLDDQCEKHFHFSKYTVHTLKNNYYISQGLNRQFQQICGSTLVPGCEELRQKIQQNFAATYSDINNLYKQCLFRKGGKYGCMDYIGIQSFFLDEKRKNLMHADISKQWTMCNSTVQEKYQRDPKGSLHLYETLLKQQNNLKIWVVSGLLNGYVTAYGASRWVDQLKQTLQLQTNRLWQPWFYNDTINAGDVEQLRGITHITVRSAGGQLWLDQPEFGYHIFTSFLDPNGKL